MLDQKERRTIHLRLLEMRFGNCLSCGGISFVFPKYSVAKVKHLCNRMRNLLEIDSRPIFDDFVCLFSSIFRYFLHYKKYSIKFDIIEARLLKIVFRIVSRWSEKQLELGRLQFYTAHSPNNKENIIEKYFDGGKLWTADEKKGWKCATT